MHHIFTYFTGGLVFSIPNDFWLEYTIRIFKYIFFSFIISMYFEVSYTALTMALAVVLADFKFYLDVQNYLDKVLLPEDEEDFD